MPKKRGKGKARLIAKPEEETVVGSSPIDFLLGFAPVSQLTKVCRLCESSIGPFLNIFEADKVTAKKIEELMPFGVAENDDLPHKICFRCSAKVEELYEFIQKCIKTQLNLRTALGKKEPLTPKLTRSVWEDKLNQSNISNDDICDAVIKKAMEGIKDIPINPVSVDNKSTDAEKPDLSANKQGNETIKKKSSESSKLTESANEIINIESDGNVGDESEPIQKPARMTRRNSTSRALRSNIETISNVPASQLNKTKPIARRRSSVAALNVSNGGQWSIKPKTTAKRTSDAPGITTSNKNIKLTEVEKGVKNVNNASKKSIERAREQDSPWKEQVSEIKNISITQSDQKDSDQSTPKPDAKSIINEKPFDIMDYVSTIKVNGVGVLFQCKLCNRNFLKIDVVQSHSCAKNRCVLKEDIVRKPTPPEPPKPPTVKYINTKLGNDSKKFAIPETSNSSDKTDSDLRSPIVIEGTATKSKPRVGPASKVKRDAKESPMIATKISAAEVPSGKMQNSMCGTINLAPTPNLNCPYKLVPGPNNTFTLVEEIQEPDSKTQKSAKKIKESQNVEVKSKKKQSGNDSNSGVVNLLDESGQTEATKKAIHKQPYPVGLFHAVPKLTAKTPTPQTAGSMLFSATAAQKQSYSIVQTSNPSKLLISAKPQPRAEEHVKKIRKPTLKKPKRADAANPFSVTLDDTSRPLNPDTFNVLNIDPLLSPSYVLPIPNESQSEAMNNDRPDPTVHLSPGNDGHYTCNMCNKVFTREQKLLAHIHSHYSKMDEEDTMRVSKTNRKRARKS